jgi:FolB domain-containing protein
METNKKNPALIHIRDLHTRCIVGINEEERREKQDVIINVSLACDLAKAIATDRLEDTINYRAIKKNILRLVEQSMYHLLECLADSIADECLTHPLVSAVTVTVDKPGALRYARSVAVEITRSK